MRDVQRRGAGVERPQHMQQAQRVGAARNRNHQRHGGVDQLIRDKLRVHYGAKIRHSVTIVDGRRQSGEMRRA